MSKMLGVMKKKICAPKRVGILYLSIGEKIAWALKARLRKHIDVRVLLDCRFCRPNIERWSAMDCQGQRISTSSKRTRG